MNYNIVLYPAFKREFKRLSKHHRSLKADLERLANELLETPTLGTDLGNGVHKVRMAITSKGRGKSGGARVITLIVLSSADKTEIGLHYIYDKAERENITDQELKDILHRNNLL